MLVIWLIVLLTATTVASAEPTYELLQEYGVDGAQIRSMDIGDIDGDGLAVVVNGEGMYGITLSATDGGHKGDDYLRLRVWDLVTGVVVYDNGFASESGLLLSHGNVIIH